MAGLVAAARARELGAEPVVYEKGTRAGGSMLLSSGFAWRYRTWEVFREQCPGGDPVLQRLILERFDDALDWLEAQGVELLTRETGNPLTVGARFDPRQLVATLAKDVRLGETTDDPTILATGGFPVRLAREQGLLLRANRWSEGDGLDLALARGATTAGDLDEFYGRVDGGCRGGRRGGLRTAQPTLWPVCARDLARHVQTVRGAADVVGDRPCPGDRALARRPCLVQR